MKNPFTILGLFALCMIAIVLLFSFTDETPGPISWACGQDIACVVADVSTTSSVSVSPFQTRCEKFSKKIALGANRIRPNSNSGTANLYTLVYAECLTLLINEEKG